MLLKSEDLFLKYTGTPRRYWGRSSRPPPKSKGLNGASHNLFAGGGSRLRFVKTQHPRPAIGRGAIRRGGTVLGLREWRCHCCPARTGSEGWENQSVTPCTRHRPRPQGWQLAGVRVWSLLCRKVLKCQTSRTRSQSGRPDLMGSAAPALESLKKDPLSHFLLL